MWDGAFRPKHSSRLSFAPNQEAVLETVWMRQLKAECYPTSITLWQLSPRDWDNIRPVDPKCRWVIIGPDVSMCRLGNCRTATVFRKKKNYGTRLLSQFSYAS